MVRDLRRLADTRFDVLVIGGGIYGAATAWDAAQRGLRVALIDRGDFGGGTSFNNLKTLHGGLRSLQDLNLQQVRRFIRERRALARIAPHLVRPLPFVVPTGGNIKRSAWVMRAGLLLNDLIARLAEAVPVPLVLHGSSGVPDDDLAAAVKAGMRKINIGTLLSVAYTGEIRAVLATHPDLTDPRRYLMPARASIADQVQALLAVIGRQA